MATFPVVCSAWHRFLAAVHGSNRRTLLETRCDAYRAEAHTAMQCAQRADQMFYPQFRAELLRIAAEVQAHLPWLREQILALGGDIPSAIPRLTPQRNSWECLRRDVEEARRGCDHLLEWIHQTEREEPATAMGLQRIRKDKVRHCEELRQMLMKSNPYTTVVFPPHQNAHRTQA